MRIKLHRSRAVKSRDERHDTPRVTGTTAALRRLGTVFLQVGTTALQTMPARAGSTTSALQVLPDSTLRGLAAASAGLGTGFFLAGVPRIVVVGAIVPALAAVAAIAARPVPPAARITLLSPVVHGHWRTPLRRHRPA